MRCSQVQPLPIRCRYFQVIHHLRRVSKQYHLVVPGVPRTCIYLPISPSHLTLPCALLYYAVSFVSVRFLRDQMLTRPWVHLSVRPGMRHKPRRLREWDQFQVPHRSHLDRGRVEPRSLIVVKNRYARLVAEAVKSVDIIGVDI